MGSFIKHTACPNPECSSSDGCAVYDDDSYFCFVCQKGTPSESYKEENPRKDRVKSRVKSKEDSLTENVKTVKEKEVITPEKAAEIKEESSTKGRGFRGIDDTIYAYFGVRHSYAEDTGDVMEQLYPCTQNSELVGYKIREVPKDFRSIGRTGATTELFMQFRFSRGGKYLILTEGEVDSLSAYQMMKEYNTSRGTDYEVACVSATIGANSSKQIANNYKFLDSWDQIIVCYDNDKAGQAAIEDIVKVLPKGKIKIMKLRHKDPNEYLTKGDSKAFITDFYNAKSYVPAGVVGSSDLYDKMLEQAGRERIPFPPFLTKLETMLGSWELQTCGVIAAGTGAAKTTIANEIIYHLLFNTKYKTGIVSLELDSGQYAQALLSKHIQNRISSIHDPQARMNYLKSEDIKSKSDELFKLEDGSDRFMVLDERNFSIDVMEEKIIEMIVSGGCQIIVLDPVSDLFEDLPHEAAAGFMKFIKSTMKNYPVSFLLLAHIRKSSDNKGSASTGAFVPEEAIFGSGALTKSASWVAMLSRDKYNEDEIVRNTTHVVLSKNRRGAVTGKAGQIYYNSETHQMVELEEWLKLNGPKTF